ncbi:HAAS signaling domain-containing protein [Georgenia yuyongxinii]|uniref:Uncharacterized protein n=1 Tax=Georgenia yuyongxinii TaxID=2589797 RepID=A0A552WT45_9MICO|nr:hypothetical protein [Georgenia yuyongxinii]TRW45992.1 hypothetical protein FJ693_07505 [Georgenia yuyongxinii]
MQADGLVTAYLDDLGRMLRPVEPTLRAEVLGGVREHIEAVLGARPWDADEVEKVLLELGAPEEVASAALEDGRRDRVDAGWPEVAWSADGPRSAQPRAPRADHVTPPALARAWVPPTVGLLLLVTAGLYVLVLGAIVSFSAVTSSVEVAADVSGGGFAGPTAQDLEEVANPLMPVSYDLAWSVLVPLPLVAAPWLVAMILLTGSPLWSVRQKWVGAAVVPGLVLANGVAIAVAMFVPSGAGRAALLVGLVIAAAVTAVVVVVRIWRDGARRIRARELAR